MHNDDLPQEVILAIQRVLEAVPGADSEQLNGLPSSFNAVAILNDFFPDGATPILIKLPYSSPNSFRSIVGTYRVREPET
jgi:hypothetical protein